MSRLTTRFYEHVKCDSLLAPVFVHMGPDHPSHVAAFLAEVLGGPASYSEGHGGHPHMIQRHLDRHLTQEQRRRWVSLLLETADELRMPDDPEFRSALVGYLEWGSRLAVINSQPGAPSIRTLRCSSGVGVKSRVRTRAEVHIRPELPHAPLRHCRASRMNESRACSLEVGSKRAR